MLLFFCPKYVRLNCTNFLVSKLNNGRELQNIAIDHSADIDYKEFLKIYTNCAKETYNFLTINTTLPINDRFKKNLHDTPL